MLSLVGLRAEKGRLAILPQAKGGGWTDVMLVVMMVEVEEEVESGSLRARGA